MRRRRTHQRKYWPQEPAASRGRATRIHSDSVGSCWSLSNHRPVSFVLAPPIGAGECADPRGPGLPRLDASVVARKDFLHSLKLLHDAAMEEEERLVDPATWYERLVSRILSLAAT